MRAIAIERFGDAGELREMELPRPRPESDEVLLRVVAAGVSRFDCSVREGRLENRLPHGFPLIPGWDAAGVIEEFGAEVGGFRKGDRVWACARKPTVQWGCYADYVAVPQSGVALVPSKLLFEEAAAVPCAALTAWQSLFGSSVVDSTSKILILGAASGVGHLAVQLARNAGAHVVATANDSTRELVSGLGASAVIDPTREDLTDAVRRTCPDGVDFILDTIGGEELTRSVETVRAGGRVVSCCDEPDSGLWSGREVRARFGLVEPAADQLGVIARMFDTGRLRVHVERIHSLSEANQAHETVGGADCRGAIVLNL